MNFSKTALAFATLLLISQGAMSPVQAQSASEAAELERLEQELERLERELEPLLQALEDLEPLGQQIDELMLEHPSQATESSASQEFIQRSIERTPYYQADLAACLPATYENYPLPGTTEIIRGWVGDTCQVDKRISWGDVNSINQCFYTRQDIELITGPELYFSEDLERQCHRIK